MATPNDIADIGQAEKGRLRIEWAASQMPVLGLIREQERTESGHRLYGERVFERLERIKELRGKKTLRQIREVLKREMG